MMRLLTRYLDSATPAAVRAEGPDAVRRAHTLLLLLALMETQGAGFGALYLVLGLPRVSLGLSLLSLSVLLVFPAVQRRSTQLASDFVCLAILVILDFIAMSTGGIVAPALEWTPLLPAIAGFTSGGRRAWPWLVVVAINALLFAAADWGGIDVPMLLPPWATAPLHFSAIVMMGVVIGGIARAHESTREAMLATVTEVNAGLRQVLDNVDEGFLVAGPHGEVSRARTAVVDTWFGPPDLEQPVWTWLAGPDERFASWMELAWSAVFDDLLPFEVSIAQLPKVLERDGRTYGLRWTAVGAPPTALVGTIRDETADVAARRTEERLREQLQLLDRLRSDPRGYRQFVTEGNNLVADLFVASPELRLRLHTLKGNCAMFGAGRLARLCHHAEAVIAGDEAGDPAAELRTIRAAWAEATASLDMDGGGSAGRLMIGESDIGELQRAIHRGARANELTAIVDSWRLEPVGEALRRLGERGAALAARLGKPAPEVLVDDHGLRLPSERWASLWQALVHVVRNAVDHGIEPTERRLADGKPARATLRLEAERVAGMVVVRIGDDGGGVDWAAVASVAANRGMPHGSVADLQVALMSPGVTTRSVPTETSGRGMGLAATQKAARELGGDIWVESTPGRGTTVCVTIPSQVPRRSAA